MATRSRVSNPDKIGRVKLKVLDELRKKYPQVNFPGQFFYCKPALEKNMSKLARQLVEVNCAGADMPGTYNRAFAYPNAPKSWERGDTLMDTVALWEPTLTEVEARITKMFTDRLGDASPGNTGGFTPGG